MSWSVSTVTLSKRSREGSGLSELKSINCPQWLDIPTIGAIYPKGYGNRPDIGSIKSGGEPPLGVLDTDYEDLETPALLDLCVLHDPGLLTFRQDGRCLSKYDSSIDSISHERVRVSIHLYHLDHPRLVAKRREVWRKVDYLVKRGERHIASGERLTEVNEDLPGMIHSYSPLYRVARLALRGNRDRVWVRDWLEEIETTL